MKYYQLQARDIFDDTVKQRSDPHTWNELEELYHEYETEYEDCEIEIIFLGIK